jgi:hypothetical protein
MVHGRLAAVSVRASMVAGWWVGVTLGLVIGSLLGAALVWFTGAVLDWQRDLGFTLGIARTLLPFGDQIGVLRWVSTMWWLVIPGVAVGWSIVSGVVGGLIGGLLAAVYNRSPRHASVVVELPQEELSAS